MDTNVNAVLSNQGGVNTSQYNSYDNGGPESGKQNNGVPWHRRLSPEAWLAIIVLSALASLWALAGGFRKILS